MSAAKPRTVPVLSLGAVETGDRLVWLVCVATYLAVFGDGVLSGGSDLVSMVKAVAATFGVAVLGRLLVNLLAAARRPADRAAAEAAGAELAPSLARLMSEQPSAGEAPKAPAKAVDDEDDLLSSLTPTPAAPVEAVAAR